MGSSPTLFKRQLMSGVRKESRGIRRGTVGSVREQARACCAREAVERLRASARRWLKRRPPPAHGRLSRQRDRSRSTRARMLSRSHRSFPLSQRASIYSQAVGRRCNTDRTQAARSLQRSSTYVYFHTVQASTLPHPLPRRRPPCDIFDLQTLA